MTSDREKMLEDILARLLRPFRGVPFEIVVKSIYDSEVYRFDKEEAAMAEILCGLIDAMNATMRKVRKTPIVSRRPNEVGNYMENPVLIALKAQGFDAGKPKTRSGKHKQAGYPDLAMETDIGRIYIEVKTYNKRNVETTQRSFYFSPSDDPKVHKSGWHILAGFEMTSKGQEYWPVGFKLVDLYGLSCDLKSEFLSDNARLYESSRVLAAGRWGKALV